MSIVLCTICLNEMEWLPKLYEQHRDWPDCKAWIFVEGADTMYQMTNPHLVSDRGLSTDGTTEYLEKLAQNDPKVHYLVQEPFEAKDPAQGKCVIRSRYLTAADEFHPDLLVVIDADEFYPKDSQERLEAYCRRWRYRSAYSLPRKEIWRPPSRSDSPLFSLEIIGGFWAIPYCRVWRWYKGLQYIQDHNTPELRGTPLDANLARLAEDRQAPYYCHLAFASSLESRQAKHHYYQARGEGVKDHRADYVRQRAIFETWKPGDILPPGVIVRKYKGVIPECFA